MKHLNFNFLFSAFLFIALLSSCTVTKQTFTLSKPSQEIIGNKFDDFKGITENQILRTMSAPDREISDGAGGKY